LGEEHRLRVFENKVVKKLFGPKRDKVTGGRRTLHNELHDLLHAKYYLSDQIKKNEMCRTCGVYGGQKR
jgi:hypothetical protein